MLKSKFATILVHSCLTLFMAGLLGCSSGRAPGSSSHAAVKIQGHTVEEIQQTAVIVFRESGYHAAVLAPSEMIFDRPGSRYEAAKWGGLLGSGVVMRVKVQMSSAPESSHLLQADAFAVQDANDPVFQNENRKVLLNRGPYQKLLNEIKRRLK